MKKKSTTNLIALLLASYLTPAALAMPPSTAATNLTPRARRSASAQPATSTPTEPTPTTAKMFLKLLNTLKKLSSPFEIYQNLLEKSEKTTLSQATKDALKADLINFGNHIIEITMASIEKALINPLNEIKPAQRINENLILPHLDQDELELIIEVIDGFVEATTTLPEEVKVSIEFIKNIVGDIAIRSETLDSEILQNLSTNLQDFFSYVLKNTAITNESEPLPEKTLQICFIFHWFLSNEDERAVATITAKRKILHINNKYLETAGSTGTPTQGEGSTQTGQRIGATISYVGSWISRSLQSLLVTPQTLTLSAEQGAAPTTRGSMPPQG